MVLEVYDNFNANNIFLHLQSYTLSALSNVMFSTLSLMVLTSTNGKMKHRECSKKGGYIKKFRQRKNIDLDLFFEVKSVIKL